MSLLVLYVKDVIESVLMVMPEMLIYLVVVTEYQHLKGINKMDYDKLRLKIKSMIREQVVDYPNNMDNTDWYLKGKLDAYIELFDEEYMWDVPKSVRDVIQEEIKNIL